MSILKPYHIEWLSSHKDRSEEWLREKLKDGFDIHHLDGVHSHNSPENLVLIEHNDHMRLHGGGLFVRFDRLRETKLARLKHLENERLDLGKTIYEMKISTNLTWEGIDKEINGKHIPLYRGKAGCAMTVKKYALVNSLKWPLVR